VGILINKAINPKMNAGLNCTIQYKMKIKLRANKKGNARPKKAGNQNTIGEMYFANTEINKLTMIK